MIIVLASICVKSGKRSEFLEIFNANVPKVKAEEGCIEYGPAVDFDMNIPAQQLDEHVVTIVEKWQSPEALTAHFSAPHMLEYRKKVQDIVETVSLKVLHEA